MIGTNSEQGEVQEAKVLNRVIRIDKEGWSYEADQRHAYLLIDQLHLQGAKSVSTPGEGEKPWLEDKNGEFLRGKAATEFRAMAARANYLAQDRSDIHFAVKEICRTMASPTKGDVAKLRRLGRYLLGNLV